MHSNFSAQQQHFAATVANTKATESIQGAPTKIINDSSSASPNSVMQPTAASARTTSSCTNCSQSTRLNQNLNRVIFEQAAKIAMLEQALAEKTAEVESLLEKVAASKHLQLTSQVSSDSQPAAFP